MNYREYTEYYYNLVYSLVQSKKDVDVNKNVQEIIRKIVMNSWLNRDFIYMSEHGRVLEFMKVLRVFYYGKKIHPSTHNPDLNSNYYIMFKQNKKAIKHAYRERRDTMQMIDNYTDTIKETDENIQELCSSGEEKILYGNDTRLLSQLKCEISRKIMLLENRDGHCERLERTKKIIRVANLKAVLFGRTMEFSTEKLRAHIKSDDILQHICEFVGGEFMTIVRHNIICDKYNTDQLTAELNKWRMTDLHTYCDHMYVKYSLRYSYDVSSTFCRVMYFSKYKKEGLIELLLENFRHTFEFIRDIIILTPAVEKMIKTQKSAAAAKRREMRATAAAAAPAQEV